MSQDMEIKRIILDELERVYCLALAGIDTITFEPVKSRERNEWVAIMVYSSQKHWVITIAGENPQEMITEVAQSMTAHLQGA